MAAGDDSDDSNLFRQEMKRQGVKTHQIPNRAITNQQASPPAHEKLSRRSKKQSADHSEDTDDVSGQFAAIVDNTLPGEPVLFVRAGNRKATIRAFRRGQLHLDESIDLHGMREVEAKQALIRFFEESRHYQWRCVQIIHGKGANSDQPGGVLRPMTLHWLKQQSEVRAFCSADTRDGGTGATNVLLAR